MRFIVSCVGTCSFCPRIDGMASAFAGVADRNERICGICLGLHLTLLRKHDERADERELVDQLARIEPKFGVYKRVWQTVRDGGPFDRVDIFRQLSGSDKKPEEIRAYLEGGRSNRVCSVDTGRGEWVVQGMCSFCNAPRDKVLELYTAPRGVICDRCLGDASAAVVAAMLAN
jgi:hypothetical protein